MLCIEFISIGIRTRDPGRKCGSVWIKARDPGTSYSQSCKSKCLSNPVELFQKYIVELFLKNLIYSFLMLETFPLTNGAQTRDTA